MGQSKDRKHLTASTAETVTNLALKKRLECRKKMNLKPYFSEITKDSSKDPKWRHVVEPDIKTRKQLLEVRAEADKQVIL